MTESGGWTITKMYLYYLNLSMLHSIHRPQFPMAGLAADPSDMRVTRSGPRSPLCGHRTLRILCLCRQIKWVIQSSLPFWLHHVDVSFYQPTFYLNTPDFISVWGILAIVNLKVIVIEIIKGYQCSWSKLQEKKAQGATVNKQTTKTHKIPARPGRLSWLLPPESSIHLEE